MKDVEILKVWNFLNNLKEKDEYNVGELINLMAVCEKYL